MCVCMYVSTYMRIPKHSIYCSERAADFIPFEKKWWVNVGLETTCWCIIAIVCTVSCIIRKSMAYLVNGAKQPIHNSKQGLSLHFRRKCSLATLESAACSSDLKSWYSNNVSLWLGLCPCYLPKNKQFNDECINLPFTTTFATSPDWVYPVSH